MMYVRKVNCRLESAVLIFIMLVNLVFSNINPVPVNAHSTGYRVTVSDGKGNYIEGASVLIRSKGGELRDSVITNASGHAKVNHEAVDGQYEVLYSVYFPGYAEENGSILETEFLHRGLVIKLKQYQKVKLSGSIRNEDNMEIPDASVELQVVSGSAISTDGEPAKTSSNENGAYQFSELPGGNRIYSITVSHKDYITKTYTVTGAGITIEKGPDGQKPDAEPSTGGAIEIGPSSGESEETEPSTGGAIDIVPLSGESEETEPSTGGAIDIVPPSGESEETEPSTGGAIDIVPPSGESEEAEPSTGETIDIEEPAEVNEIIQDFVLELKKKQEPLEFQIKPASGSAITTDRTKNGGVVFQNEIDPKNCGSGAGEITYQIASQGAISLGDGAEVASIDSRDGKLNFYRSGVAAVTAVKAMDDRYQEAKAEYIIEFQKAELTDFKFQVERPDSIDTETIFTNEAFSLTEASPGAIRYKMKSGSEYANIGDDGTLKIIKVGKSPVESVKVTVLAEKKASEFYKKASAEYTITIKKAMQKPFYFQHRYPEPIIWNQPFFNQASGGTGDGKIIYSSGDGEFASVNQKGEVTGLKSGAVTITAVKEADDRYKQTLADYTLTLRRARQNGFYLEAEGGRTEIPYQKTLELSTKDVLGKGAIQYYSADRSIAEFKDPSKGTLTIYKAGQVKLSAIVGEDDQYESGTAELTLSISKGEQEITFNKAEPCFDLICGEEFTNPASGGEGTGKIYYEISETNGAVTIDRESGAIYFQRSYNEDFTVTAVKEACDCYLQTEKTYTVSARYLETPEDPFTLTGDTINDSGWFTGNVTIKPKEGYLISFSDRYASDTWSEELVYEKEGSSTFPIFLINKETGFMTGAVQIEALCIDKTGPENLKIQYRTSVFETILENVTMGFSRAEVRVTLEAEDGFSGIESIRYHLTDENGTISLEDKGTEIAKENIAYGADGKKASAELMIPAQFHGRIAFTAADRAGFEREYTDQKIIVVDSIAPDVRIGLGSPSCITDKDFNTSGTANNNEKIMLYDHDINVTLMVDEANFLEGQKLAGGGYVNDFKLNVKQVNRYGSGSDTVYVPGEPVGGQKQLVWNKSGNQYQAQLILSEEGDYFISADYGDKSGNSMNYTEITNKGSGSGSYQSPQLTIDKSPAEVSIITEGDDGSISSTPKTVQVLVTKRSFNPSGVDVKIEAKDIEGSILTNVDVSDLSLRFKSSANWERVSGDTWSCSILFMESAVYTIKASYMDIMGNAGNETKSVTFTIDKDIPDKQKFEVKYSVPVLKQVMETLTFGYYQSPVTVTLKAEDPISGIERFQYKYTVKKGASSVNQGLDSMKEIILDKNREKKKIATAEFQIPAEFYGTVSFSATDRAGNASKFMDDNTILVVDSISPTCKVEMNPVQIIDADTQKSRDQMKMGDNSKLFFNGDAVIKFEVSEANFYKEDFKIKVSKNGGTAKETAAAGWTQDKDRWNGSLTLSGDGDYIVTMQYKDRSGNKMAEYKSNTIVIDTAVPEIGLRFEDKQNSKTIQNRLYCGNPLKAVVIVKEHNFRAADIKANLQAVNGRGQRVSIRNYEAYLKNQNNWVRHEDTYEAELTFSEDANYTLELSVQDLALNQSKTSGEKMFTVDTGTPEALTITYGASVLDTVLQSVTFGFYSAQTTAKIEASDTTAGIESFSYTLQNDGEVGGELRQSVAAKDISYSDNVVTASAAFPISGQAGQFKGIVGFKAVDRSGNEAELLDKKVIVVDTIAPEIDIEYSEPETKANKAMYYGGKADIRLIVKEDNFYEEDVKVSVVKTGERSEAVKPDWSKNGSTWIGTFSLEAPGNHSKDGEYRIQVDYTDKSRNAMKSWQSEKIILDTVKPEIEVQGVKNEEAYKDEKTGFKAICRDINIDVFNLELSVVIKDENGRIITRRVPKDQLQSIRTGVMSQYTVENLETDGVYYLSCSAADLAGNQFETELTFSVNRKGSAYKLQDNIRTIVSRYYVQQIDENLDITEINVDPLSESEVKVNDKTLVKGQDYQVSEDNGDKGSWYQYTYSLNAGLFQEEGEYHIVLASVDKVGTVSYSDLKNTELSFAVDRTPPEVVVSGVEEKGRYQTSLQNVTVIPRDDGGKMENLKVILNKKDMVLDLEQDKLIKEMDNNNNRLSFTLSNGANQNISIECADAAGNRAILDYDNVTVSNDWYVLYYTNKPLLYSSAGGAGVFILILGYALYSRRKKAAVRNNAS